jgi:hypothetical protein
MESADAPQHGDIERVVMSHLVAMPARPFAREGDNDLPADVAAFPAAVREALRDVASHVAQAQAVARLACASRAGNELAKGSALPAHMRSLRRTKLTALCNVATALSDAQILSRRDVQAALVGLCKRDLSPQHASSSAEGEAAWYAIVLSTRGIRAAEPHFFERARFVLGGGGGGADDYQAALRRWRARAFVIATTPETPAAAMPAFGEISSDEEEPNE